MHFIALGKKRNNEWKFVIYGKVSKGLPVTVMTTSFPWLKSAVVLLLCLVVCFEDWNFDYFKSIFDSYVNFWA